jgi:GcrA cell cycle regulator
VRSMGAHLEDCPMTDVHWSDDRVTTLKSLWLGGLSASKIAKQLGGVTRNAVIGKVHRLGLGGRAKPSAPPQLKRMACLPVRVRAAPPSAPKARSEPLPYPVVSAPKGPGLVTSVVDLGAHLCKWPLGDPKTDSFSFCGRPASGPYCGGHAAVAFQPGKAKRLDRDPVVRAILAGLAA